MLIKELIISNFRGIKTLNKKINQNFFCLIGSGDSAKTTILNAIEYLFYPSWRLNINDNDFHDINLDESIKITATIINFPEEFLNGSKFGLFVRGWNNGVINDEPTGDDKIALTIQLSIDNSLEPEWKIINDREPDGKKISHTDRAKLKVMQLGDYLEKQFYWRQGTLLNQLTDETGNVHSIILEANRKIKEDTSFQDDKILRALLDQTFTNAKKYGVKLDSETLEASLDSKFLQKNLGIVGLHDGDIPLRLKGLSTKRLFLISLQLLSVDSGATLLIDEIELGLEPHRLRNILRKLKNLTSENSQIFITTHSPIATVELEAEDLFITTSNEGDIKLNEVDSNLQGTIRSSPEALFGKTVIICEGQTEVGICRSIDRHNEDTNDSFSYLGINVVNGGGSSNSSKRALNFKNLGFKTILFVDSDKLDEFEPNISELSQRGISPVYWDDNVCTEERVILDLPAQKIIELLELACEINDYSEDHLVQSISSRLNDIEINKITDINNYTDSTDQLKINKSISKTLSDKKLFKNTTKGEKFGDFINSNLDILGDKDTGRKLSILKDLIYES